MEKHTKVEDTLPSSHQAKDQQDINLTSESSQKEITPIESPADSQKKELNPISDNTPIVNKEINPIALPSENKNKEYIEKDISSFQHKEDVLVNDLFRQSAKKELYAEESNISLSKEEKNISLVDTNQQKIEKDIESPNSISRKQEQEIKSVEHAVKEERDAISTIIEPSSKDEIIVDDSGVMRNKKGEAVVEFKNHLKKREQTIASTEPLSKTELVIDSTVPLSKEEQEIASTTPLKKEEQEIASTTPQSKEAIEIASTTSQKKEEKEIASTISQSKNEVEIASSPDHQEKDEIAVEPTTPQNKEAVEVESTIPQSKEEQEVAAAPTHLQKTEYSYDEILQGYIENALVEYDKKTITTQEYSTELNNKESKAFSEDVHINIPPHIYSLKEAAAGLDRNDIPRIDGFDSPNVGQENYVVSIDQRTNIKIADDINDNVSTVNGLKNNITAPATSFDGEGEYRRSSQKIADKGSIIKTADPSGPKTLSTAPSALAYSEVRNASDSEYRPVYDMTNLIPPREGLVDLLKTAAKTFGLTKYVGLPIPKPNIENGAVRFIQRALTGEAARYVYSRLHNSVLMGYNASKIKERNERPAELSVSGALAQADKVFDVLNPVINTLMGDPLSLFKDKDALAYKGIVGSMGNQIDRSASSIYGSMSNYYNAVRSRIMLKQSGYLDKVYEIEKKIKEKESEMALKAKEAASDNEIAPTNKKKDKPYQDSWWDTHKLESYKKKKGRLESNIKQLNAQHLQMLISLDSPSEYEKYLNPDTSAYKPLRLDDKTWSVSMKRGEDGPESSPEISNTHLIDPSNTKSLDWRSFNLNKKPNSEEDFIYDESSAGYLFNDKFKIISSLKEKAISALKEQTDLVANAEKIAEDAFNFQFLLTDYGDRFGNFITEIANYYSITEKKVKDSSIISTYTHFIPTKEITDTYSKIMDPESTTYAYVSFDNQGNKKASSDERTPAFNDPHLISTFEKLTVTPMNPRQIFYDSIQNSEEDTIKSVKDQIIMSNDINLTSINYAENKIVFNYIEQVPGDSKANASTPDEKRYIKNALYSAALNYLTSKDENAISVRNPRLQIQEIIQKLKDDSNSPLGSSFSKYEDIFSFNWSKSLEEKSDYNASMFDVLPDSETLVNTYSTYEASDSNNVNSLYKKTINITDYEDFGNPEAALKNQVDALFERDKKRVMLPIGMSMVSSEEKNNIKAVVLATEDGSGYDVKYVKQSENGITSDTNSYSLSNPPPNETTFSINDLGETKRNTESSYYKKIIENRSKAFPVNKYNMTIKVSGQNFGTIPLYDTGLGGLLVASNYNVDRQYNGNGSLFFAIPFQFNPELSGESRSANWNSATAFGRTHEHFVYSNSGARGIQFKTTYAVSDFTNEQVFNSSGEALTSEASQKEVGIERNDNLNWLKGWTEDYVLMVLNMYRSLTIPMDAYGSVTPPIVSIDFGKLFGTYTRGADKYVNSRWIVSEYSIDANLDAGYTLSKTPRLFEVSLTLKEVYNGWHDLQDFYIINKHLKDWSEGKGKE